MLKPVNGHLLIEPLVHKSFVVSDNEIYEEIGIVLDIPAGYTSAGIQKGDRVYFDSWLAAKYPKNDKEFFWLVKWDDVRAIEKNEV